MRNSPIKLIHIIVSEYLTSPTLFTHTRREMITSESVVLRAPFFISALLGAYAWSFGWVLVLCQAFIQFLLAPKRVYTLRYTYIISLHLNNTSLLACVYNHLYHVDLSNKCPHSIHVMILCMTHAIQASKRELRNHGERQLYTHLSQVSSRRPRTWFFHLCQLGKVPCTGQAGFFWNQRRTICQWGYIQTV